MKAIVISLGGSLIVPDKINFKFLERFKATLRKHCKNFKFVIVCGGGSIARKYISALKAENKPSKDIAMAGMRVTRMNALFLIEIFGKDANESLPTNMKEVKDSLGKNKIVICGALRYSPNSTSDGTAAKIASYLKSEFINLTNVDGLYTDNPLTHKNARFIPYSNWKDFEKRALKIKFSAGQHFVLDQEAAVIIRKNKIKTYIIGENLSNLDKILSDKNFVGTLIYK